MSERVPFDKIKNEVVEDKDYLKLIQYELEKTPTTVVVLDDDPTGTQTVHDIAVVTNWEENTLEAEIVQSKVFFILTNSRSLTEEEASQLNELIGQRLAVLAERHKRRLLIISRGDSTLRGHYPQEVLALTKGLGQNNAKHLLIPAFFDGGRFTINDVHYVREGNELVPVGDTQFSKDNSFGYLSSNLQDYILEKYDQKLERATVGSIALKELRENGLEYLEKTLNSEKSHLVVNAMRQSDLELLALSCLRHQDPLVFRTAASFVNAIAGIKKKPILGPDEVLVSTSPKGALLVVGSYVPKTTEQLTFLKSNWQANYIEYDVLNGNTSKLIDEIDLKISEGEDVVLYTSRKLVKGVDKNDSLRIINKVSRDLVHIVKSLKTRPKYILAKGGITSSDIATKALAVSRAIVLGQVHNGVPVWRLSEDSKFPGLSYVVFPGNVGDETALWNVVNRLS